jgi:stage V sporulation protein B
MYPTAISEIIEAASKLVVGLTAAIVVVQVGMHEYHTVGTVFGKIAKSEEYAKSATLPYAVAGAIFGVTVSSVLCFLFLLISHRKNGDGFTRQELSTSPPAHTMRYTAIKLLKNALPIGISAVAINIAKLVDTTFLQTRIADVMHEHPDVLLNMYKGMIPKVNIEQNTVPGYLYGCYCLAIVMFTFVPSITQAFSTSALPSVTNAWTRGDRGAQKRSIETVIRFTALISIPSGLGISVLARPIITLVFGTDEIASRVLIIMGIGVIFASLSAPLYSMLQAVGRIDLPVKLLLIGLTIKVVLNYILTGIPEINVLGAGAGTLVCYAFTTVMAIYYLCKQTHIVPNFVSVLLKPLLASVFCAAGAYFSQILFAKFMPDRVATCCAIVIAVVIYSFALLFFRAISRDDVIMLPKGQKIAKILEKHNWIG